MTNKTKEYYRKNAISYFEKTSKVDMKENCDRFLWYLENNSTILDFGCGSSRDIKYFKEKGFRVHGVDGSKKICELARKYSQCEEIECIDFLEFDRKEMYDGTFACASLLHLNHQQLRVVLRKVIEACFDHGIIYASFKLGDFEGYRDDRYYLDMTSDQLVDLIYEYEDSSIEDMWISDDVLRENQQWINVILRVVK